MRKLSTTLKEPVGVLWENEEEIMRDSEDEKMGNTGQIGNLEGSRKKKED